MCVLGLDCTSHLKFSAVIAHVCAACELIGQALLAHIFLNAINYLNDVINIFLKFFSFL